MTKNVKADKNGQPCVIDKAYKVSGRRDLNQN